MAGKPPPSSLWHRLCRRLGAVRGTTPAAGKGGGEPRNGTGDCDRIAEDLKASERRYRDLIEGSIQGILVHRDFKPLFVNRACAESLGYDTPEEVLKLGSLSKVLAPHERKRARDFANARMRGETVSSRYEQIGRASCRERVSY